MSRKFKTRIALLGIAYFVLMSFTVAWVRANDSAVETSVGGLKLRKEHSVSMEKETLFISPSLVAVEYEFLNTTQVPVSSEVAFPIPPYRYDPEDPAGKRDFADFKAWVDGEPIKVKKEARAFVGSLEVTRDLQRAGIPIERFANFSPDNVWNEICTLKPNVRRRLIELGALKVYTPDNSVPEYWPEWETHLQYHWRQEFPPGKLVRIRHEYTPVRGFSKVQLQDFRSEFADSCISDDSFDELSKRVAATMKRRPLSNNYFHATWVSYILTTANTWKTPIRDFRLMIQGQGDDIVTFCWPGPVEKEGVARVGVLETNFIPKSELKVYFLRDFGK